MSLCVGLHDRTSAQFYTMSGVSSKGCVVACVVGMCGVGMHMCGKMCPLRDAHSTKRRVCVFAACIIRLLLGSPSFI